MGFESLRPSHRQTPILPVERPILCNPYEEPSAHWEYDRETGMASKMLGRRPAEYWYRTKSTQRGQSQFEFAEGREPLVIVNLMWRTGGG